MLGLPGSAKTVYPVYTKVVADDSQETYSAREIVLEFFPATRAELIPHDREYCLNRQADGGLLISKLNLEQAILFTPIGRAGKPSHQVCCDICQYTVVRGEAEVLRAEVPGSAGRRYRYICVCRNSATCDARRIGDRTLKELLARVLKP